MKEEEPKQQESQPDPKKIRKNANARAKRRVEQDKGLQAVITELMVSNETLSRIETTVDKMSVAAALQASEANSLMSQDVANSTDSVVLLTEISHRMGSLIQGVNWLKQKSNQIAEYTDEMVDSLNWLSKFFSTNKLQAAEDRREFLALIRAMKGDRSGAVAPKPQPVAPAPAPSRGIGLADAAVGAGLLEKLVKGAAKAIAGTGGLAAGFITGIISSIKDLFLEIGGGIFRLFKRIIGPERLAKIEAVLGRVFGGAKGIFSTFMKRFEPLIKLMKGGLTTIAEKAKPLFSLVEDIIAWIGEVAKPFFKIGKLLGRLAVPITVIMGAYETLVEAFKSFEKGDAFGDVLKNAVAGLVNSLVAGPLDLVKNAAAWILKKLGATDIAAGLSGWDFKDWFSEIIDRVVTWGRNVFSKVFADIFDAVDNIRSGFGKGFFAGFQKTIQTMVHYLVTRPMQYTIDMIASLIEKIPLFGKSASDWILKHIDVDKLYRTGLTETEITPFNAENEGVPLVDAVLKRHEARLAEEETKNRVIPKVEEPNTGAEMNAVANQTKDLQSAPTVVTAPSAPKISETRITNNASNINYNAAGLIDRTDSLLAPRMAW